MTSTKGSVVDMIVKAVDSATVSEMAGCPDSVGSDVKEQPGKQIERHKAAIKMWIFGVMFIGNTIKQNGV